MTSTQKLLLRRLAIGPATTRELQPVVNIHLNSIQDALKALRKMRLVYIRGWSTRQRPIWAKGLRWDEERPAKMTRLQYAARYRTRHRELIRQKNREWWQAHKSLAALSKSRESKSSPASSM